MGKGQVCFQSLNMVHVLECITLVGIQSRISQVGTCQDYHQKIHTMEFSIHIVGYSSTSNLVKLHQAHSQ